MLRSKESQTPDANEVWVDDSQGCSINAKECQLYRIWFLELQLPKVGLHSLLHQGQPGYVGGGGSSCFIQEVGGRYEELFPLSNDKRRKESLMDLSAIQELVPGTPAA